MLKMGKIQKSNFFWYQFLSKFDDKEEKKIIAREVIQLRERKEIRNQIKLQKQSYNCCVAFV